MTDNRTNEGVSAKAECTPHHWVSHHQVGLPVRWIEQCSLCGSFNAESLREQIYRSGGQFTEAQVEAAAKAIADCHNPGMFDRYPENWRVEARAALVAAQGAAPQAANDIHEPNHDRVYCVRCGGNWPCQPAPQAESDPYREETKMSEYTPTTEEVRARYSADEFGNSAGLSDPCPEFDRWLAKHDRDVKAEAYDEALQDAEVSPMLRNPYREETEPVGGIHSNHCDDRGCLGCECDPACDDYEETE